jgi:two-component system response regulator DctR
VIHIVEDDDVVRDALVWLCRSRALTVRAFADGRAFLAALEDLDRTQPTCVLLDVRMPGLSGVEVFDQLLARGLTPPASVIFLTGHGDIPMAVEMVKKGAFDFFEKPFSDNELVDRLVEGEMHSATLLSARPRDAEASEEERAALDALSKRERQVMDQILLGKSNKVIAINLGISARTVEAHRARIFRKLGVDGAVSLARRFAPTAST